jgi:uncharacterized repeat protein (TIGR03803 family)
MKKLYLILFVLMASSSGSFAQGIYQLWGNTVYGGAENDGVFFSTRHDGSGYTIKKNYTVTSPGDAEQYNKPVVYNAKMYTMTTYGGLNSDGVIAEYDPVTNNWTKKVDLFSIGSRGGEGSLIVYNSKLYGIGRGGDIFEYNPANNALAKLHSSDDHILGSPRGTLVAYNNKFYGVGYGGVNGAGVIFEFDPATNVYSRKYNFNEATTGKSPAGGLTFYNGKLWGTTVYGGLNDNGTLYSYDPATHTFSKKKDMESVDLGHVYSRLTVLNNKLYGSAFRDGASDIFGGIFEYNPATDVLVNEFDYDGYTAHFHIEFTAYNGKLYATSVTGGQSGEGVIFSFDPSTDTYQELVQLAEKNLHNGSGPLTFYNNKFYGLALDKGDYGKGALFSYDPVTTNFISHVHLGGPELLQPTGPVLHYNNKLYGTASFGGDHQRGGIYEYDLATGIYSVKKSFPGTIGTYYDQGGLTLYNNKFYGVTHYGGTHQLGTLYEYDPATNDLVIKHNFETATGSWPHSNLVAFNGKLYGMCINGSTNNYGNIYEFDPATGVYAQKVIMGPSFGGFSRGGLTLYNNKLYGTASTGGAFSKGTIFEYNPVGNIFIKKADFEGTNGTSPRAALTPYNGKLYGTTFEGGAVDSGVIFQYDPATAVITKKFDLTNSTGDWTYTTLAVSNNKLYGMTSVGASSGEGGLFQFDPITNIFTKKTDFNGINGARGISNNLVAVPAPTAPGSPNACINTQTININAANANEWIAFTDAEGRAVAEINAQGNILGNTAVRFYVNGGNIRQDGNGRFYLDRSITITSQNNPASPVSVRLYIKKTEFESLKATAGSGVVVPTDLAAFKNDDFCSGSIVNPTTKLASTSGTWGFDYVYTTQVSSFSSFYFAGNAHSVLPVHMLSFKGNVLQAANKLEWKASCTNGVKFTVERSNDGISYSSIGMVPAQQQDCNNPFFFNDVNVSAQRYYYRLHMQEDNGAQSYSGVIILDRQQKIDGGMQVAPNPVTGTNTQLKINASKGMAVITLTDAAGRMIQTLKVQVSDGVNSIPLNTANLAAGVYLVVFDDGKQKQTTRLIKQ